MRSEKHEVDEDEEGEVSFAILDNATWYHTIPHTLRTTWLLSREGKRTFGDEEGLHVPMDVRHTTDIMEVRQCLFYMNQYMYYSSR